MQTVFGFPYAEVQFTRDGRVHDPAEVERLSAMVSTVDVTDLFVVSHGWNNDMDEARRLYADLLQHIRAHIDANAVPGAGDLMFGVLAVLWPSKKFAEKELIPSAAASLDDLVDDTALAAQVDDFAAAVGGDHTKARLEEIKPLIPQLDDDPAARRAVAEIIRSVLPQRSQDPEDASDEFFSEDPGELMERLAEIILPAPILPTGDSGGAADFTDAESEVGQAQGLSEVLDGARAAARRLLNYATYYVMKDRAGLVGRGLVPVLEQLNSERPDMQMHLVGHSFGGRLVTSTTATWDNARTAIASLCLLQAAFSHNGFAQRWDGTHDGAFRGVILNHRVSGPVMITCTKNDRAVGLAYPIASRIARQAAAALGDRDDPYGGLGRNGAQRTPEATDGFLLPVGGRYSLSGGRLYNLVADDFISDHGDIVSNEVTYALLTAVTT
ncbi:MAG: hypothetical protein M3313_09110 [Actinomycetota bacterium]|nr:hypothetical protein [Actinomycetota bacterium]